jgi:signal transduction histidine kinase
MHLYGDKNRFVQVIINFLSNSLKFSDQGSKIILHLDMLQNQRLVNQDFFKHKSINESIKSSFNPSLSEEMMREKSLDLNEVLNQNNSLNS